MKRLLLVLLLIGCLVLTACYPVSHHTEESAVPGTGVLHIDYEIAEGPEKEVFKKAASYKLSPNDAKLYIYRAGTYNANEALGPGSVAELEANDALFFQRTGNSSYRLSIRYSGLEDGVYEIHWDDLPFPSPFYFEALDEEGNVLEWEEYFWLNQPMLWSEFCSYDSYVDENGEPRQAIVFVVENGIDVLPAVGGRCGYDDCRSAESAWIKC